MRFRLTQRSKPKIQHTLFNKSVIHSLYMQNGTQRMKQITYLRTEKMAG
jgi:hypothetical protein